MADYTLGCGVCDWQGTEDSYYTSCPACGGLLEVHLDQTPAQPLDERYPSLFKYHPVMPYEPAPEEILKLETYEDTPLVYSEALSDRLDVELFLKDETVMPSGTWKDREGFVSIYRLLKNRVDDMVIFSSGNTGTSLARSASIFRGPRLHIVVPRASEKRVRTYAEFFDEEFVKLHFFEGSNDECIVHAREFAAQQGIVSENGFSNYARREGLKLLGLELILGWGETYDWYVQPIAGGIGVYSLFKAYSDLGRAEECPRILGVQAGICAPMVNAWRAGASRLDKEFVPKEVVPSDYVRVLRTRRPDDSYPVLKPIMDRVGGRFEDVSEQQIHDALRLFYREDYFKEALETTGRLVGLEPATALAGIVKGIEEGYIQQGSRVVLNVSGAAKDGDIRMEWIQDLLTG